MTDTNHQDLRQQPVGDLVKQLSTELSTLVRQEIDLGKALLRQEVDDARESISGDIALAKDELSEKGKHAGMGAGMFGGAAVAAVLALGTFTAFLIYVLDSVMKDWLAAIIIAAVWAVAAFVLVQRGRAELKKMGSPVPQRAVQALKADAQGIAGGVREDAQESAESIKEDVQWAKTRK